MMLSDSTRLDTRTVEMETIPMKLICEEELIECLAREDLSTREKIIAVIERQPIVAYAEIKKSIDIRVSHQYHVDNVMQL